MRMPSSVRLRSAFYSFLISRLLLRSSFISFDFNFIQMNMKIRSCLALPFSSPSFFRRRPKQQENENKGWSEYVCAVRLCSVVNSIIQCAAPKSEQNKTCSTRVTNPTVVLLQCAAFLSGNWMHISYVMEKKKNEKSFTTGATTTAIATAPEAKGSGTSNCALHTARNERREQSHTWTQFPSVERLANVTPPERLRFSLIVFIPSSFILFESSVLLFFLNVIVLQTMWTSDNGVAERMHEHDVRHRQRRIHLCSDFSRYRKQIDIRGAANVYAGPRFRAWYTKIRRRKLSSVFFDMTWFFLFSSEPTVTDVRTSNDILS